MVSSVSNTVYGIIVDAMLDAGKLAEGQEPNSEQLATNMRRLNDMINLWQTQGLKLFLLQDVSIPLVANKNKYRLQPTTGDVNMSKPLQVLQGYVLDTNNIRRPVIGISWDDWMRLSQVTGNAGRINSYFVDKQAAYYDIYVWNTPDATEAANTLHLLMRTQVTNPINLEEDMAFPQEWRLALRWGLADEIATGQPQAIMDRCAGRAKSYREALEDFDVEDVPTRFAPDMSRAPRGGFR